jgi:hypothetical protein
VFCIGCGKEVNASDAFCRSCGRSLSDTKPVQHTYRAPTKGIGLSGGKIVAIVLGVVFLGAIIRVATRPFSVGNENSGTSPAPPTAPSKESSSVKTATFDEASAVIKACGKPAKDHPQELNAGAGSEGRALEYSKYNTELWFYRGPESAQWMLMSAFSVNGDSPLEIAVANKWMPCMKGGLQDHYHIGVSEKEAAETDKAVNKSLVDSRKAFARELDSQLLEMGIESKTFILGQDATTLVVQDALAGRVRANQLSNNSILMAKLKFLGFKKLKYNNGFEGEMFSGFDWDLTK